jgi:lipid-A-disaccharide synthase
LRIFIIAGEHSGDLHGANLVKAIRMAAPETVFSGFGGDRMQEQGVQIVRHLHHLSFMGFAEVLKNIGTIMKNFKVAKLAISEFAPDAVILIDYPGFNLRMAEFIKKNNITCIYYISPQLWAWKESRVKKVRAFVDRMYVILPFEKEFYRKHGMEVFFKGHPLLDALAGSSSNSPAAFLHDNLLSAKPLIALLPGSRKQEIFAMLPVMVKAAKSFSSHQAVIAGVSGFSIDDYRKAAGSADIKVVYDQTYDLLRFSEAALVTSGTATLETGLIGTPLVVCYKGSSVSYMIAKRLVKVKYISLVNLILDKPLLKELIQDEMNVENVRNELHAVMKGGNRREAVLDGLLSLRETLGGEGASARIADDLLSYLNRA